MLRNFHDSARSRGDLGEWAFYAAALLIVLALVQHFPYRLFYKTHRLLAVAYVALAFHAVVLMKFSYWTSPVGLVMALLLAYGALAAVIVLLRRVGANRQVEGRIASIQYYAGVRALETQIDVPRGWPGHKPGQFAFATSDASEGAHPTPSPRAGMKTNRGSPSSPRNLATIPAASARCCAWGR